MTGFTDAIPGVPEMTEAMFGCPDTRPTATIHPIGGCMMEMDADLYERMVALVKKCAGPSARTDEDWGLTFGEIWDIIRDARAIVAELPEAGDPDLLVARELIADAVAYGRGSYGDPERKNSADFRNGDCDAGDLIARAVRLAKSRVPA